MKLSSTAVLTTAVALVFLFVALFLGLAVTDHLDASTTPMLTSVLAAGATLLVSLLNLLRTENVHNDLQSGLIEREVTRSLENGGGQAAARAVRDVPRHDEDQDYRDRGGMSTELRTDVESPQPPQVEGGR